MACSRILGMKASHPLGKSSATWGCRSVSKVILLCLLGSQPLARIFGRCVSRLRKSAQSLSTPFYVAELGLDAKLCCPVVQIDNEEGKRPFVGESFVACPNCWSVVRLAGNVYWTHPVGQFRTTRHQKSCLCECFETSDGKLGILGQLPFLGKILQAELQREPRAVCYRRVWLERPPPPNTQLLSCCPCICTH